MARGIGHESIQIAVSVEVTQHHAIRVCGTQTLPGVAESAQPIVQPDCIGWVLRPAISNECIKVEDVLAAIKVPSRKMKISQEQNSEIIDEKSEMRLTLLHTIPQTRG